MQLGRPENSGRCDGNGANRVRAFHWRGGAAVHCERPRHAQYRRHRFARLLPVNFVLRGGRGDVLGGVLGQLWGGWLQVTCLWVTEAARGAGHGARLLEECRSLCALARRRRGNARDLQLPGAAILRAARLRGVQRAGGLSSRAREVLPEESLCIERRRQITAPSRWLPRAKAGLLR